MPRRTKQKTASEADLTAAIMVAGEIVAAGTRENVSVPVGRLPGGNELQLPVIVIHGARPGPKILLDASIHGDEINGLEIILNVVEMIDPKKLRGTIIAVPVVNVFGFVTNSRYLPDRRDLNRSFPGNATGSLAARLAHLFMNEIVVHADVIVDLHTGSLHRANLPQIRANLDDPIVRNLSATFAAPIMIHSKPRDGSLRKVALEKNIPCLVYEAGESSRFDAEAVKCGVAGIQRLLASLDMIDSAPPPGAVSVEVRNTVWVRAKRSGILRPKTDLGDHVQRGQLLAIISDTFGRKVDRITSPHPGIILGLQLNPLVYRGDALFHVANVDT